MTTQIHVAKQPYYRLILAPEGPAAGEEIVYHASWSEACAELADLLPDDSLSAGFWGRVFDPRTRKTFYRDALCLE